MASHALDLWPAAPPRPTLLQRVEAWLETERDQLALWVPVALGLGIGLWFWLPAREQWIGALTGFAALAATGLAVGREGRLGAALMLFGLLAAAGMALIWGRATLVAAPVLERAGLHRIEGLVERVQPLPARDSVRLLVRPGDPALPPRIRLTVAAGAMPAGLGPGDRIRARAWLMPPAPAAVPGGYDFERAAWFAGIGATGRVLGAPERLGDAPAAGPGLRQRLTDHIRAALPGAPGAVASALATGDQGAIPEADAEAMRRSGLAHLLSISGLHVTAVVGATMLMVLKLLALSPTLALRWPLLLIAAGAGALAGIGYTLLAGGEVPTVRSCVAALLVLAGLALGRDAITLRLVAAGGLVVLLLWPEAIVGASFQLSFAAVTAIVALHNHPRIAALLAARAEGRGRRLGRILLSLLLSGLAVELVLAPIALHHFHKAGLYGALANIVAIPFTTFVVMPLEALALVLDLVGLGAPVWWLTGLAIRFVLALAHAVASAPGAVSALPTTPTAAFALAIAGGLWLMLWNGRVRYAGAGVLAAGLFWAILTPRPDLLVTGDGRHLMLLAADGTPALLRPRAGDYVRDMLGGAAGLDEPADDLAAMPGVRCSADTCVAAIESAGRRWRLLATRSGTSVPWLALTNACAAADIAVSDRRLPAACAPRWLKLDRATLARTGGITIDLARARTTTVRTPGDDHPWVPRDASPANVRPARTVTVRPTGDDQPLVPRDASGERPARPHRRPRRHRPHARPRPHPECRTSPPR